MELQWNLWIQIIFCYFIAQENEFSNEADKLRDNKF